MYKPSVIEALMDHAIDRGDYAQPADWYLAAGDRHPGPGLTTPREVTGSGYGRFLFPIPESFAAITPGSKTQISNIQIAFGPATGAWTNASPVSHVYVYDATSAGNIIGYFTLYTTPVRCILQASTGLIVCASGHGFIENEPVRFDGSSMPAGLSFDTVYYAREVAASSFKIAAAPDGAPLAIATQGTGFVGKNRSQTVSVGASLTLPIGSFRITQPV